MIFISVDMGGAGLLLPGIIPLLTGKVSVSIMVAQSWSVLIALATNCSRGNIMEEQTEKNDTSGTKTMVLNVS